VTEVRFQLDAHVPDAVAEALRRRGVDVQTANEAGLRTAPDSAYVARAIAEGRVIVTHDSDFLRIHHSQQAHAGIAYCGQGKRTIGEIIAALVLIYEVLDAEEMNGRLEFI
jgi:predicted nuclease of predicted toxin-antitoxin system